MVGPQIRAIRAHQVSSGTESIIFEKQRVDHQRRRGPESTFPRRGGVSLVSIGRLEIHMALHLDSHLGNVESQHDHLLASQLCQYTPFYSFFFFDLASMHQARVVLVPVSIILSAPLLRIQLNKCINPHNRHTSLHRTLQLLYLTHTRLQHSHLDAIRYPSLTQVQPIVLVVLSSRE